MLKVKQNKIRNKFTMVPNSLITDVFLTSKERMIVVYLFSRPDGWVVRRADVKKVLGIKDNTTYAIYWRKIYASGWVSKQNTKDKKGQFVGYTITLNDEETVLALREKPDNGKNPTTGKTRQREKPDT